MSYDQPNLTPKPDIAAIRRASDRSLIGDPERRSSPILLQDYVNAFVINEAGDVLVLEAAHHGRAWASWHMIGRDLAKDEDPMLAVQQELLLRTGYICEQWIYLGTFVLDESQQDGAGHFFFARNSQKITTPDARYTHRFRLKWVSERELKQALLDGRIALINHAIAASLAMVMRNAME